MSDTWSNCSGHYYKYFQNITISEIDAAQACAQHKGLLVSIDSEDEMNFIEKHVLFRRTLSAFIGGTQISPGRK